MAGGWLQLLSYAKFHGKFQKLKISYVKLDHT